MGRFTGIANFSMLTGDIDVIDSNDPEEEKLAIITTNFDAILRVVLLGRLGRLDY